MALLARASASFVTPAAPKFTACSNHRAYRVPAVKRKRMIAYAVDQQTFEVPGVVRVKTNSFFGATSGDTMLSSNTRIVSSNGMYSMVMQADGNLVMYGPGVGKYGNGAMWALQDVLSGDAWYSPGAYAVMHPDGRFSVFDRTGTVERFHTESVGKQHGPFRLTVSDDGRLVIYDNANHEVWDNKTGMKQQTIQQVKTVATAAPAPVAAKKDAQNPLLLPLAVGVGAVGLFFVYKIFFAKPTPHQIRFKNLPIFVMRSDFVSRFTKAGVARGAYTIAEEGGDLVVRFASRELADEAMDIVNNPDFFEDAFKKGLEITVEQAPETQ